MTRYSTARSPAPSPNRRPLKLPIIRVSVSESECFQYPHRTADLCNKAPSPRLGGVEFTFNTLIGSPTSETADTLNNLMSNNAASSTLAEPSTTETAVETTDPLVSTAVQYPHQIIKL